MVEKYSIKKDGNKKLSANFMVSEFKCNDGSDTVLIDTELVKLLQKIRDHFGKPIAISSAYRTPSYNKKIGGVNNSQHTKGTAADIVISGVTPKEVAQYAEFLMPHAGGIGVYSSFTHVDVRVNRARWENFGTEVAIKGFPGYTETTKVKTAVAAVQKLFQKGIINSPNIWYNGSWTDTEFKTLLKKVASYISGKPNYTTTAAIAELQHRGIINTPDIWYKGTWEDTDFKSLLIKVANYIN